MHLSTTITIVLPSLVLALPQVNYCASNKDVVGHCETLTYIDRTTTSSNPPSTADCQYTCRSALSEAGDWSVDFVKKPDGYKQGMMLYPCGFSMGRAPGQPNDYYFYMSNQDIGDIIDEVTKKFAPLHDGKVAAEGTIRCDGYVATWYID